MEYLTPWERYRNDAHQRKLEARKNKQTKAQEKQNWENSIFYKIRSALGQLALLDAEPDAYIERTLSRNISFIRDVIPAWRVFGMTSELRLLYREGPLEKVYNSHYIGEDATITLQQPDKYGIILEKGRYLKHNQTIEEFDRWKRTYGSINWQIALDQLELNIKNSQ